MSVAVDVSREATRVPLSEQRVREIVRAVCRREKVRDALVSVAFVSSARIARMNREFLSHRGTTDVITFELEPHRTRSERSAIVGDIYIAPEVARRNARDNHVGIRAELTRLVIHGTLHVLGYTHEEGSERTTGEMWRRQEAILASIF